MKYIKLSNRERIRRLHASIEEMKVLSFNVEIIDTYERLINLLSFNLDGGIIY